jgi:ribosome modulation factor
MKRQKRNHIDRAFAKGYQTAINGRSRNVCPYEVGPIRQEWFNGWREGREDLWSGYNRLAQAQKLTLYC